MVEKKFTRNLKHLLKNSWDILPGINEIQLIRGAIKVRDSLLSEEKGPSFLKVFGRIFLTPIYITYTIASLSCNSINPIVWNEKMNLEYKKIEQKYQHQDSINTSYNSFFKDVKTKEDSINFYYKNCLEKYIQLKKPSFQDREKVCKNEN